MEIEEIADIKEYLTPEVINAQKEYNIKTFFDILNALVEHPQWLVILRRLIIPGDLLELPQRFDAFFKEFKEFQKEFTEHKQEFHELKEEFHELKEEVHELKEEVHELKQEFHEFKQETRERLGRVEQDVAILKQDVAILKKDVAYLKGEFGRFKGKDFERTIRERYYAYFGRILKKSKRIDLEDLLPVIEKMEDSGKIDEMQGDSLLQLDLIVEGVIKKTGKQVALAIEASYSIYEEDLNRATERAEILAVILDKEVIPTIVGVEVSKGISEKADEKGILLITVDY